MCLLEQLRLAMESKLRNAMVLMKPGMSVLEWRGEHDLVDVARVTLSGQDRTAEGSAEAPPAYGI